MNIDHNIISFDNSFNEQHSQIKDNPSASRVHLKFCQLKEMKKSTLNSDSVKSLSFYDGQSRKNQESKTKSGLIFRFLKVFRKKILLLKERKEMFSIFKTLYQDANLKSQTVVKLKPDVFLFDFQNSLFQIYQWIKCILLVSILIIITYLWCFCEMPEMKFYNLDLVIILLNIFDILSQFNLAKIIKGQIIYERLEICKNYLQNQFFEDFLFGLSFTIITQEIAQDFFIFIFYISGIFKLFKMIHQLEERLDLNYKLLEVLKLTKLLFLINLLSHFIACVWIKIGISGIDDEKNWIQQQKIQDQPQYIIYISSFYWAVTTMVTVGYGDITPQNYLEKIVCIFVIILSCGVYGYSLNIIGQIVSSINHQADQLEKKIRVLNKYFKQHNIEEKLQSRIKNYLEYKIIEEEAQQFQNVNQNIKQFYAILDELPNHFKQSVINDVFQDMIKNCPILYENFSKSLIQKASSLIQPKLFQADDYIIDQNNQGEAALYFIDSGQLQLCEYQSKVVIKELGKGQFFGEYLFFTNTLSKLSLKCKTNATIFILKRSDFMSILHKDDFEIFHSLKNRFEFQISIKNQQKCYACEQSNHVLELCNNVFYVPEVSQLFVRKENQKQFRRNFQRKQSKTKWQTQIKTIQMRQFHFQQDYQQEQLTFIQQTNEGQIQDSYQNFSLLNNSDKALENREIHKFRENDRKEYINQKSKQSQSMNDSTFVHNLKKSSYLYINQQQVEQKFDIDRMKDYSNYFSDSNAELLINRYNKAVFQNSITIARRRRQRKAMRYIQM